VADERSYVFISYSRHDEDYVNRLVAHLAEHGISSWIDKGTDYGNRWVEALRDRVDRCAALIVIMSPSAEASEWVEREILRAEATRKTILPLRLAGPRHFLLAATQHEDVLDGRMPLRRSSAAFRRCWASHRPYWHDRARHPSATSHKTRPLPLTARSQPLSESCSSFTGTGSRPSGGTLRAGTRA
jgi:hypothetical protein